MEFFKPKIINKLREVEVLINQGTVGDASRKVGTTKGQHFWARGYYVSMVGIDEVVIREYIRRQEDEDRRVDQLSP